MFEFVAMKRKINIEYTVFAVISSIVTIAGAVVSFLCAAGLFKIISFLDGMSLTEGPIDIFEYYAAEVLTTPMGALYSILLFCSIITVLAGAGSGLLSYRARFHCTDGGTVKTGKYKALMAVSFIIMFLYAIIMAPCFIIMTFVVFTM